MTRGAVYWHFADKMQLFRAVWSQFPIGSIEESLTALQDNRSGDSLNALSATLQELSETVLENKAAMDTLRIMTSRSLESMQLVATLLHLGFQRLPFHQKRMAGLKGDHRVGDPLVAGEEKGRPLLRIGSKHPSLEVEANGQIGRVPQELVVHRDAVQSVGKLTVEDGIIDAIGIQTKLAAARAILRCRQASGSDTHENVIPEPVQPGPSDGRIDGAVVHLRKRTPLHVVASLLFPHQDTCLPRPRPAHQRLALRGPALRNRASSRESGWGCPAPLPRM